MEQRLFHAMSLSCWRCGSHHVWPWPASLTQYHCSSFSAREDLFSLPSNEVSLYDCAALRNQSYTGGVNRTETNAAVTRQRTLPMYGLIIQQEATLDTAHCVSTLNMRQAASKCWPQRNVEEESVSKWIHYSWNTGKLGFSFCWDLKILPILLHRRNC